MGYGGRKWFKDRDGRPARPAKTPAAGAGDGAPEGDDYERKCIVHPRLRCPYCGSWAVVRTGTDYPQRWYRCSGADCRKAFTTWDDGPRPLKRGR